MHGDNLSGKKKYTDGKIAKYFFPGEQPEGWVQGSTQEKRLKNSIAQKEVWKREEYRQKVDKYYHGEEYKERRSDMAKKSWENYEQKCKNIKAAQKKRWVEEERKKQSERMINKWKEKDYHSSQSKKCSEGHKNLGIKNPNWRKNLSEAAIKAWENQKEEILQKQFSKKSENNSWNSSKLEDNYYEFLLSVYEEKDIIRQYRDARYPFYCDFYIKSEDLFIEIQGTWCHGGHFFDNTNEEDLKTLSYWQEKAKTSDYYKNAIKTWTETDPQKKLISEQNHLNIQFLY